MKSALGLGIWGL